MGEVPEIRLAVFGASMSGKTTLLASYYGNQQRHSFEEAHGYRLEAEDVSDGNRLLQHYYKMESGEFPLGTEHFAEHRFNFKLRELADPGLKIVWYDYPGGWWERTPKDDSERAARQNAFEKLLTSQVGVLLIDGERWLREDLPYVRHLLDMFKTEARRICDTFAHAGDPIRVLPEQWLIAISKTDLLPPGTTAEQVCKQIVAGAGEQLAGAAGAVGSKSFGHQFLFLSSVRADGTRVLDACEYVGLQLMAPVALMSVLEELASKADTGTGFGILRQILERAASVANVISKFDHLLPKKYRVLSALLEALALKDGLGKGATYFREKQAKAAKRGETLNATAAAMRAELASADAQVAFYRNQGS